MGFWQGLGRMVSGKPVFQAGDTPPVNEQVVASQQPQAVSNSTPLDSSGRKIIPEVEIDNIDCNRSADSMNVWVTFKNGSAHPVYLDKITILGQTKQLDFELSSGAARQVEIYRGQLVAVDAYKNSDLYYRLVASGDYFQARYFLEFDYDDGFYYPEQLHLQRPIRDI